MDDEGLLIVKLAAQHKELKETIKQLQERIARLRGTRIIPPNHCRVTFKLEETGEVVDCEFDDRDRVGLKTLGASLVVQRGVGPNVVPVVCLVSQCCDIVDAWQIPYNSHSGRRKLYRHGLGCLHFDPGDEHRFSLGVPDHSLAKLLARLHLFVIYA